MTPTKMKIMKIITRKKRKRSRPRRTKKRKKKSELNKQIINCMKN